MNPKINLSELTYRDWQRVNKLLRRHCNPYPFRLAIKKLMNLHLELEEAHDLLALGDLNSPSDKTMLLEDLSNVTTALETQKQLIYDMEQAYNLE